MTELRLGFSGTSEIKFSALLEALDDLSIRSNLYKLPVNGSGVNEQPEGWGEIIRGATNRALFAHQLDSELQKDLDAYFSVENGLVFDKGSWLDYAVCLAYLPAKKLIKYEVSAPCVFPTEAVEVTLAKPGGFQLHTVGKTLAEMGLVSNHQDPHFDLCGTHRKDLISLAFIKLLSSLFGEQ